MEKKWVIRKSADESKVRELSSELGIDPVLAELLVQRGVNTFEEARAFSVRRSKGCTTRS